MKIDFRKYTKKQILESAIQKRTREDKVFCLFFQINTYEFGVIYEPTSYANHCHFDFFCLSENLKTFTETGYRSIFAGVDKPIYDKSVISEFLFKHLEKEGLKIKEPSKPLQLTLF